jgi:hypothetical protein
MQIDHILAQETLERNLKVERIRREIEREYLADIDSLYFQETNEVAIRLLRRAILTIREAIYVIAVDRVSRINKPNGSSNRKYDDA